MLPENINHFFRYQGSLTTPPCYESILWTVFDTPITLSHNQVQHTGSPFFQNVCIITADLCACFEHYVDQCHKAFSSSLLCSDQETGEYSDGHGQQDAVEWLPHGSASQQPCGGVFFPAAPGKRKYVACCRGLITKQGDIMYSSEWTWPRHSDTSHFSFTSFFSAFCRQDEIESRLLNIEGLITSLGKHIHSGEL